MKKNHVTLFGAAIGMLLLILDGQTALSGAREGVDLCIRVLIPSLFPFFVLSGLLTRLLIGHSLAILRPIGNPCGIPKGAESLLLVGLLGGYPVGAQNVADAYRKGFLPEEDALHLLSFCNNAGPAFLFGVIGQQFDQRRAVWLLWMIHILSALLTGAAACRKPGRITLTQHNDITITDALEHSVRIMSCTCGWVVLFRILIAFLERWFLWMFPIPTQVLLTGILELSNGCIRLRDIQPEGLRFCIAGVLLSLGGVCVAMQTATSVRELGLKHYYPGKLLQTGFTLLLCLLLQLTFPPEERFHGSIWLLAPAMTVILLIFLQRKKNISRFPAAIGV